MIFTFKSTIGEVAVSLLQIRAIEKDTCTIKVADLIYMYEDNYDDLVQKYDKCLLSLELVRVRMR